MENKQQDAKITEMTDEQLNAVTGGSLRPSETEGYQPMELGDPHCNNYSACVQNGEDPSNCCKKYPSCPRCLHN